MDKVIREGAVRVGVNLDKSVIQVDASGRVVTSRAFARDKFIEWCVTLARLTLQRAQCQLHELDAHLAWFDERIAAHGQHNAAVKTAASLLGIGPVTASAVVATVGDFKQFNNGAQFGVGIGLTPRQHSGGGKSNLGGIAKRGDTYLRTLLIQGAKSAVMTAHRRTDKISQWSRWPTRMPGSCGR
jgi:transposase